MPPSNMRIMDARLDRLITLGFLSSVLTLPGLDAATVPPPANAPTTGAYTSGTYRNLFAEQGHSQQEINARIQATFQQLFHGDKANEALYYESGSNLNGPLAYITDVANHDARTEGMSYGMMIAVQMNHKREFDAIWNWANTYMLITDPKNPSNGYFAWSMNVDGSPRSDSPAPDGEEYFVMALYFADHRWGSGTGLYNYKAQADRILSLMRHHPVQSAVGPFRIKPDSPPFEPQKRLTAPPAATPTMLKPTATPASIHALERTVGPMINEKYHMILFVPNSGGNTFSDPSYHLPAFYELWARWGPVQDRDFWKQAAKTSRSYIAKVTNSSTGLSPERANLDGSYMTGRDGQLIPFSYDSWRTASNWAVDYSWWRGDSSEPVLTNRIQTFLYSQGIRSFADQYTLDGKALSQRHSTGMLATTATSGLATPANPTSKAFVEALWNTPVPSGEQRYYDGMLYLMSLLHCSGQYRIWNAK